MFFAILAIAAVSLFIAVAFALAGAWLVLPFAGLELAGLGWAIHRHARSPAGVAPAPAFLCPQRAAASRVCPLSIAPFNQRRKLS
ncbi:DUF2244 domain-containing protein [Sulfurisoma sediminicola]|uniref:DUF2244 domain-containing protein n=1 Tax=Sulfurisoma sediminicola TaxID=1381557 RepID=UPI001FB25B0F|nr:DUF2244 domain-containing protein [Sulfurisoma sediminicola]